MKPIPRKIRSGADIFKIGEVIPLKKGSIRVIGKRVRPDYVDYIVEDVESPAYFRRFREKVIKVLNTKLW